MSSPLMAVLVKHEEQLINGIVHQLGAAKSTHYPGLGRHQLRLRVERMLSTFVEAIASRPLEFVTYFEKIARERVAEGFYLNEVQLALSVFEENIWHLITENIPQEEQVPCLAQATGVIGAAKDHLAQVYLKLLENAEANAAVAHDREATIARGTDPAPVTESDRPAASRGRIHGKN